MELWPLNIGGLAGRRAWLELQYWFGAALLNEKRQSPRDVILRFHTVRPALKAAFQPWQALEITPVFLRRVISALRRWDFEIVPLDQIPACLARGGARFAALSFDTATQDFVDHALRVLRETNAPATLFAPTGFADGVVAPWWLALEQVVARNKRIGLWVDGSERRFDCASLPEKRATFFWLWSWLMQLGSDGAIRSAVRDLAQRYGVDENHLGEKFLSLGELRALFAEPLLTIGSATVSYPLLPGLDYPESRREIEMGRSVLHAALGVMPTAFAYPFGLAEQIHIRMASEIGYALAVTGEGRMLCAGDEAKLMALPRILVDGRFQKIRYLRAMLARGRGAK